jgi:hypothetical protein
MDKEAGNRQDCMSCSLGLGLLVTTSNLLRLVLLTNNVRRAHTVISCDEAVSI